VKKFAVVQDGTIINLIVAETKESAESVTELECIEYIVPELGWTVVDGNFVAPSL
jgi:hypothetical protein